MNRATTRGSWLVGDGCEAPDDAVMGRYAIQFGSLGFVRTKKPETASREIIRSFLAPTRRL